MGAWAAAAAGAFGARAADCSFSSLRCLAGLQVTGGAGFIGSHVVTRLVELYGYRVRRCCALQRRRFRRKA